MPWSIGLHLGEHFADFVAVNNTSVKRRFIYPQPNMESALQQALQELGVSAAEKVCIHTEWPFRLAVSNHESSAAVLVTAGFENWLEMTTPLKERHFTSDPQRPLMPIDRDLFIGVSERTTANGKIEKAIDLTELEFLVSKLQLHQIKNVAVCFLNSKRNNGNELRVKEFLEPKGFRVHLSSDYGELSSDHGILPANEKPRFWTAILDAYIFDAFTSRLKKIVGLLEPFVKSIPASIFVGPHPIQDVLDGHVSPLRSAISYYEILASELASEGSLFYAGCEAFVLIAGHKKRQNLYRSYFGPIALSSPAVNLPRLQPLTLLTKGFIAPIEFSSDTSSYDHLPMVFGRGLTPTFFDLFWLQNDETNNKQFTAIASDNRNERGRHHLVEQLSAYARNFSEQMHMTGEMLANDLFQLGCDILRDEIESRGFDKGLKICGPLAPFLAKPLGGIPIVDDFTVLERP